MTRTKRAILGIPVAAGLVAGSVAFTVAGVAVAVPGVASAQQPRPVPGQGQDQAQARYKIFVMEGVLEKAVQNGAATLSRQIRAVSPDAMFLTGAAQVRGFRLDGYGVFFDVEVPALRPTVAWTLRAMAADNGASLAQLKAFVQKVRDPQDREELLRAIRQIELQMPGARTPDAAGAPGVASAQTVAERTGGAAQAPRALQADPSFLSDPAAAYTREVKAALIDAMLENSGPLTVGPEEWLTVAARDSEPGNQLVPGDAYDTTTWVLRVKGSDLAAFRGGKLTLEEARARVEVREF